MAMTLNLFPWENENKKPVYETSEFEMWLDETSTRYARQENSKGISLKNWTVLIARNKKTGQSETRVLYDSDGHPVDESPELEQIGVKIDLYKFLEAKGK